MRTIDMQTWPRREHFELFSTYAYPHFGMCANVDLTPFYPAVKKRGYSLTVAIVYVLTRASNAIPEFRYRIREGKVIEHEVVNPGFTFLAEEDVFSFCTVDYVEDFSAFAAKAAERIALVKENPWVHRVPRDDLLYMTAIPWVSFTSFQHTIQLQPADSIPRFVWGKFFEEGELLKMPLSVQAHHALLDGVHVGKLYAEVQDYLLQPLVMLGED
ncbi:MAG: chloramphenicol acetyltransferase [Anaerolineales bacterium]|nr:MAG: chloramphenicol acetyltransferase [Anaerolineales bacterium]